jgi:hypothetical protein
MSVNFKRYASEEYVNKKIANISQPDWNQNDETAPDYIKNRTHGINTAPLSVVESNFGTASGYTSYKVGPYEWKANKPISLIIDGVLYEFDSYNTSGYSSMLGKYVYGYGAPYSLGNITDDSEYPFTFLIISNSIDDTEEYAHIEFADGSMNHMVEIFGGIKQLDEEFIPDSIARTANVLPLPSAASVGQILRISEVDENGNVTAVEAVDAQFSIFTLTDETTGKKYKLTVSDGNLTMTEVES